MTRADPAGHERSRYGPRVSAESDAKLRAGLLLFAFGVTTIAALTVAFSRLGMQFPGTTNWLVAASASALGAWFYQGGRLSDALAAGTALFGIAACYPSPTAANASSVLIGSGIIVLWAGLLLPKRVAIAITLCAWLAPWVMGLPLIWLRRPESTHELGIFLHTIAVGVPLGVSLIFRLQQDNYRMRIETQLGELRAREVELEQRLQRQMAEIEMSKEKLAQAQKLETVGTMASGLAHELNNLLVPIRGLAEVVAVSSQDDRTQHYGRRILDAAESAAAITGALLTYARKGNFAPIRTNLRHLIEKQVLPVLSRSIPEAVDIRLELAEHVACDVDRVMMQQALTNLIFNAVDAMPNGGQLTVRLFAEEPDAASEGAIGHAYIEVADEGEGITPDVLEHIFDPFFTTKEVGSGTGLGLAMVHGCVVRHGGEIEVFSQPDHGSRFVMCFPQAQERKPSRPWPVLGERRDRPVVVVASPDVDTLDELEEMLHDLEITPICTAELDSVRTMLAEVGDRVNLLLTDLGDDVEGTRRLVRDARRLRPDLPIIAVSARPPDPGLQRLAGPGPLRVARGPVDPQMMATLLSDLLRPEGYELPYWALPTAASGAHFTVSQVALSMKPSSGD